MFRKTHSNGTTVWIHKRLQTLFARYPLGVFCFMVVTILVSGMLAFSVLRYKREPSASSLEPGSSQAGNSLAETVGAIGRAAALNQQLAQIAGKDSLSHSDSIELNLILNQLKNLKQTDPKPNKK